MILTACTLAWTLALQQPVDKPTLELYQQRFVVRRGAEVVRVPIFNETPPPPPAVMLRRNDTYVVWDERGLSIRDGAWTYTTRLEGLPVSPKLQSREAILETLELAKRGERSLEARAISGMRRLGAKAYLVARWEGRDRTPWLEALVSVDMTAKRPKPVLEGKFAGVSLGREPIDDRLMLDENGLLLPVNTADGWGLATFSPESKTFEFSLLGDRLLTYRARGEGALFTEHTLEGRALAGELANSVRSMIFESQGSLRFLDDKEPEIVVATTPTGRLLYSAGSGAETKIAAQDEVRRAGKYVLTWTPAQNPSRAVLFDPESWQRIATWSR